MSNSEKNRKVEYLSGYLQAQRRLESLDRERTRLKALENCDGDGCIKNLEEMLTAQAHSLNMSREIVLSAVMSLKEPKYREIMRLRYICGCTFEEIAEIMGYTYQWVWQLHNRALENIA